MKKTYLIILLFLFSRSLLAATITVQADFNPVLLSDSFHLIFEANGSVDDDPDFSPLEKDFEILSRSQSSNISIINGDYKRTKKWVLTVMAKQAGVFTLPAISFGRDRSPQMQLTVKAANPNSKQSYDLQKKQILELEASSQTLRVQGQLILTMRLLTSENINAYRFSDVSIENMDVVIEQLGKEKQYKTYRGNTPYLVVERRYALFPQQTGNMKIKPVLAEVDIPSARRSNSFFDPFGRNTQTRRLRSKAISIDVKDIPTNYKATHWLPAKDLQLLEEWPDNIQFKVGEPVTRTLSVLADGLTSAQLPEIATGNIADVKQYPDQANLHDTKNDDGIIGIREEKIALIPTRAGHFTLPAIELPWWNTQTQKMEIARIPAKDIQVVATNTPLPQSPPSNVAAQPQTDHAAPIIATTEKPSDTSKAQNNFWFYACVFMSVLWLFTLFFCWLRHRQSTEPRRSPHQGEAQTSHKDALKALNKACRNNDAQACKKALILWGRAILQKPHLNNLGELASYLEEPLSTQISALNQYLYGAQPHNWQAKDLAERCQQYSPPQTKKPAPCDSMEPLYKS